MVIDVDLAAIRLFKSYNMFEKNAFAGTGRANDGKSFTGENFQINIL